METSLIFGIIIAVIAATIISSLISASLIAFVFNDMLNSGAIGEGIITGLQSKMEGTALECSTDQNTGVKITINEITQYCEIQVAKK